MCRSLVTALVITLAATAVSAGDAGEQTDQFWAHVDNDVFAGASPWQPSAPTGKGRHGKPSAIAAKMDAMADMDAIREADLLAAR